MVGLISSVIPVSASSQPGGFIYSSSNRQPYGKGRMCRRKYDLVGVVDAASLQVR